MWFLDGHTDVERGEHGKDKCLQISHKTFQQGDKNAKEDADDRHPATDDRTK